MDFASLDLNKLATYGSTTNAPSGLSVDSIPATPSTTPTNSWTGFLGKAVDTALEAFSLNQQAKALGSLYPTGQQNPAAVKAASGPTATGEFNWKPWAIGGGVLVGALVLISVLRSSK